MSPPTSRPVRFTLSERDLILEHTFYPGDPLRLAIMEGKRIRVDMTADDLEDLLGYLAAEANHTPDARLEARIERIYDRLANQLDRWE